MNKWKCLCKQFIKFSLVGLMNTVLYYSIYMVCCRLLHMSPYIANVVAFVLSVLNTYIWQNRFVFRTQSNKLPWWMVLLRTYAAYAFSGLVLAEALTFLWLDVIKLGDYVGENTAVSIVPIFNLFFTVPINFAINKFWTYGERKNEGKV